MRQATIQFDDVQSVRQPIDVLAPVRKEVQVVNQWLNSRSEFYSRILGQSITWRKALRIGVVLPLLLTAVAICGVFAPVVTLISLASAGWITYRLNKVEKGGAL